MRIRAFLLLFTFLSCVSAYSQEPLISEQSDETSQKIEDTKNLAAASERLEKEYREQISQAPSELEDTVNKLKGFTAEPAVTREKNLSIEKLSEKVTEYSAQVQATEERIEELTLSEVEKTKKLTEIPETLAKAKVRLSDIAEINAPLAGASPEVVSTYELAIVTRDALKAKISELQAELDFYSSRSELVISQKQLASRKLDAQRNTLDQWQSILKEKTSAATDLAQKNAEGLVTTYKDIPALLEIAEHTSELTKFRSSITQEASLIESYQEKIVSQRALIFRQSTDARKRINLLKKSELPIDTETGRLLRSQRAQIPTQQQLRSDLKQHIQQSTGAQITQLEVQDDLRKTPIDTTARAARLFEEIKKTDITKETIEELLTQHRSALLSLDQDLGSYIATLKLSNEETRLAIEESKTYSLYLDERLLWIPSSKPLALTDIAKEAQSLKALVSKSKLDQATRSSASDITNLPFIWVITLILLAILTFRRKRYKQVLVETATVTEKKSCLKIAPTLKALWVTFLLILPLPILFAFISWRIVQPTEYSQAFRDCAFFFAFFGTLRVLFRPQGILVSHFFFNKEIAAHVAKQLRWFFYAIPALILTSTALLTTPLFPQSGRLVFILMLSVIIVFTHSLLLPSKGLLKKYSDKWAKFIYLLGVGIPLLFIIGLSLGYITSVQTVRIQTLATVSITLASLFVGRLLLRWILVSRRRLAKAQASKKYKAILAAKQKAKEEGSADDLPTLEEIEANALDIASVEEQTTRLVRVGVFVFIALAFWNIWSPSLPALNALDDVRFGKEQTTETTLSTPDITSVLTGSSPEKTVEQRPIVSLLAEEKEDSRLSLQDILTSISIIILTIIAAGNLPGLLELSLLSRLDLKPGGNYAVTTVLKYIIIAFGFLVAFGKIGISWASVQWLAAAVTLGIGFGLQEIFANFVAGIILLFERPLRLGDVVTVGDVSGKVTQIKIRATTILQFNNRELVVPNKEFITGQLINWTLSDNVLRFEFVVGIAYGSDTEKATKILLDIMDKNPEVLDSQKSEVFFTSFGPSTLDFLVRGYVTRPDKLVTVPSDLHYEIDKRFREADIEIAFPQTDIHIRSIPDSFKIIDGETPAPKKS